MAVQLAREWGSSVINADSRQFYREMRIGTARPHESEQEGVPHFLLGDRSVTEHLSAGDYEKEALELVEKRVDAGETPILVGGSGLYIDALCHGLDQDLPGPDPEIREELEKVHREEGLEKLLMELKDKDPVHYERVDRKNPRRVIRALEVCRSSGRPFSAFHGKSKADRPFTPIKVGLWLEKEGLGDRIDRRVERMFEEGLEEEARALLPYRSCKALQTLGYQELFAYFDGELDQAACKERIKTRTRQYAKRQMTWFRRDPEIHWFSPDETERVRDFLEERTGLKGRRGEAPSDT